MVKEQRPCLKNFPPEEESEPERTRRLEGDGEAVELEVDEVALGVAGLAAGGDVGAAGLLDGDGHCKSC
jgi:hypothetical protein